MPKKLFVISGEMRELRFILCITVMFIAFASCSRQQDDAIPSPARSVYYWKTVFKLDSTETDFLKIHSVKKIYLRYFDVDYDEKGKVVPVGTVRFESKIPSGTKIIPVVFIEKHCLNNTGGLAEKIVNRVLKMSEVNGISIDELQIDCDWTKGTRKAYFDLLSEMRKLLKEDAYLISATIRLHQLKQPAPPVDYGVLMCYNTGNLRDYKCENSILDAKDVAPFVRHHLERYKLPLCGAYPVFSWNLLFEMGQFKTILRDIDISDSTLYKKVSDKRYIVMRSHTVPVPDRDSFGLMVRAGDEIKVDDVSVETVMDVQRMLERKRPNIDRQVILFSLNSINNNKIKPYEIDEIYNH